MTGTNGATADTFEGTPSVTAVTQGVNGSVVFDAAGNVTYTPNPDFSGTDTFTYTVTSGGVTETATVTVNVTPTDDPTLITGDTTGTGAEDAGTPISGDLNASDVDGLAANPFSVTTAATNGVATIDPVSGTWSYTPNADYNGPDSFTVSVTDALGNITTQVIAITVTPVADITDDALTTPEDTAITANVLTGTNGATADTFEGTPSVTAVTQGVNGSVVFDAAGNVTYTPNPDFSGTDTFTYTVTSGGVTETATVTVTVTPTDDPTLITGDTTGTGAEDAGTPISGDLNASDVDGLAANPFSVTTAATNGVATIDPVSGTWSYTPNADYNGPDSFTVSVTDALGNITTQVIAITVTPVADITDDALTTPEDTAITANVLTGTNGATADTFEGTPSVTAVTQGVNGSVVFDAAGNVTYTPNPDFSGTDTFTYTVTSGGVTETATVTVNVTPTDDPTLITGDTTGTGAEDAGTPISGDLNASDVDGLAANPFSVTTAATNGVATIDPVSGTWSYTPNADYNGPDSFTVSVTDALGNITTQVIAITVTPVADITDDALTTPEDTAITANVLTGTNGATADTFEGTPSVTAVTQGVNGSVVFDAAGNVTYTPNPDFSGTDTFTYTVTSGGVTETATVTVTVTPTDDPTLITGDTTGTGAEDAGTPISGDLNASDVDGLAANPFSVTTAATNGVATIDPVSGTWSYTPNADYNGPDSFTVSVTDALGNITTQVIAITVTPVADITDDALTTPEDTAITANVLTGTNGATADTFEGTPSVTAVTQGVNGSVVFDAAGNVTYTPNPDFSGTDTFTYTVTSGGVTETATVTVTVTPTDDPTLITGDTTGTGAEDAGTPISGDLNASDVDGLGGQPVQCDHGGHQWRGDDRPGEWHLELHPERRLQRPGQFYRERRRCARQHHHASDSHYRDPGGGHHRRCVDHPRRHGDYRQRLDRHQWRHGRYL